MRPVHFEHQSPDPSASREFFANALSWEFQQYGDFPYWLATTGPDDQAGINGALMESTDGTPRTVMVVDTPDISGTLAKVPEHGGEVVSPIREIPNVGQVAYCHDPQGILFGVFQAASAVEDD